VSDVNVAGVSQIELFTRTFRECVWVACLSARLHHGAFFPACVGDNPLREARLQAKVALRPPTAYEHKRITATIHAPTSCVVFARKQS
jgi:hypothetical protein